MIKTGTVLMHGNQKNECGTSSRIQQNLFCYIFNPTPVSFLTLLETLHDF
jgi:hypothetical protein